MIYDVHGILRTAIKRKCHDESICVRHEGEIVRVDTTRRSSPGVMIGND